MCRLKTHFRQVPLQTVKKMLEEQLRHETEGEPCQETKQDSFADDELTPQAPSTVVSSPPAQREI